MVYRFTLLVFVIVFLGAGCKKKSKSAQEDTTPVVVTPNEPAPPSLVINIPTDADGVFMASLIPHQFPNTTNTILGNASIFLYTTASNHAYVDGGVIKANDTIIPRLSGGSYYFYAKPAMGQTFSGLTFQNGSAWDVSGNTTSGVPSFTYSFVGMPSFSGLTSGANASRTHAFNFNISNAFGADSITLLLTADSISVRKTIAGGATSGIFTPAEMAGVRKQVSTTQASLSIIPYHIVSAVFNNKKYYFVNTCTSTFVIYVGA